MKKSALLFSVVLSSLLALSQQNVDVDLKTIKTDLKKTALGFAINYLKQYNGLEGQINNAKGFFSFSPEVTALMGTEDAFSQINIKLSGFFLKAKTTQVAGLTTLDSRKTMHLFPLSVGAETDGGFSFLNTLFEGGYVPYYQANGNTSVNAFFKNTSVGIFLQAGYKSKLDSTIKTQIGGKTDQSSESLNSGLFRAKLDLSIDTKNFFKNPNNVGFGIVGKANYWYDFLNAKFYTRLEGRVRLYLAQNKSFDFIYEKGSGAPNFNTGEQFGAGLSISF
ncbi:hypothetical protein [Flavisolibacter ginsenosidimutans]|uniref:Uncharacterized protein n=1 Tax=Flavisolibacter ginsenosidimutans TaxID=661481 RepID=A0A5B8UIZ9_9BACT|nr:hypothetical protein [Flavisolibacter ginsenosidimutans]QEC56647.1 hypothetical protein FSB75_12325 [Flavisolibacter ginsenosidimutans]